MKTPDTEWEKELDNSLTEIYSGQNWNAPVIKIKHIISTLLSSRDTYWQNHEQDMYESLEKANREQTILDVARVRDERDTYWKERVREEVESLKKEPWSDVDEVDWNQALDTLLDNLK